MTRRGASLRKMGEGAFSMEQVANKLVRFLYDNLVEEETGERCLSLVRLFKTHPYEGLDAQLKRHRSHPRHQRRRPRRQDIGGDQFR